MDGVRGHRKASSGFAYRAPDKTFWFSGERCLWHLVGDDFVRVDLPPEVVNQFEFLQTITGDHQGGLWVSFGRHGLYRLANGSWTPYGGRDDLPKTGAMIIAFTDSLGRVWFGYTKSQLAVLDGDRVRRFGPSDDLQVGNITAIYGRGSKIWIGGEFGLEQFDQGRFRKIAAVDDQWLRGISGIVETHGGDLWLNAISGIFHIRKVEISEALKVSTYRVKGEHFGRREGLSGVANQFRPLPTVIKGTDGRLWFALRNGVVWLDPAAYSEKRTVPPPITIQSVSADDKGYVPDPHLSLPAHTSSVQISYSAVSLSDPEAIDSAPSCRRQTRTGTKRQRLLPLPIATFLPVPIISALRRQIRTVSGPAHRQTWLSQYCRLSTRPIGSACCAWLRFWHSFGGCINSECNSCG